MKIIVPSGMFGENSHDSLLSAVLHQVEHKYGEDFESDTFLIHHSCQVCFQEDPNDPNAWGWTEGAIGGCLWCRCHDFEHLLEMRFGTTDYGRYEDRHYYDPPNFWWKPTDLRVSWYKWIGREMASNRDFEKGEIATIAVNILDRTLEQVAEIHAAISHKNAERVVAMFDSVESFGGIHEEGGRRNE